MNNEFADTPQQGTTEWMAQRVGFLSASLMSAALAKKKDGSDTQAREDLKWDIVCERITGKKVSIFQNAAMKWGIETEPMARAFFEAKLNKSVKLAPFLRHPDIQWCGASPDGFCDDGDSLLEIKCPNTRTHLKTLRAGVVPECHKPQMLLQMAVTGASRCHFVSFDPRPEIVQLKFFHRVFTPTPEEINNIEDEARKLLEEVEDIIKQLTLA